MILPRLDLWEIFIPILALLSILIFWYRKGSKKLPPGPIGLPVVGYLPFLRRPAHRAFDRLAKKYGPLFHMYLGNQSVLVLNDFATIKEAFVKQADIFAGRVQDANFFKSGVQRIGITSADGESWRQHRRFVTTSLKDNGVGKNSLEPLLLNEIHNFMSELKNYCGRPTSPKPILSKTFLNNVTLLVTGVRYDYNNPTLKRMADIVNILSGNSDPLSPLTYLPWVTKIPKLNLAGNLELRWKSIVEFKDICNKIIEDNKHEDSSMGYENMAAAYKTQIEKDKSKTESHFNMAGLLQICRDMLAAGTETSAITLLWGMIYITNNLSIQTKIQKEIDEVIGRGRDPSYSDHSRTPYTVATINEMHRMASVAPLSLPHRNVQETKLFGYDIPAHSIIFSNLWSVHYDPKLWGDPDNFRPERFIGPDGQAFTPEYLIPFSLGKRFCVGEPLARMELYLYFTSFMQNFKLVSVDGAKLPLDVTEHFGRFPLHEKVWIESR